MEFREYAAKETSALIAKLVGNQTDASLEQVRMLRAALDAAERALADAPRVETDVQELVARLNTAAATALRRIRDESRAAIDAVRSELDGARADLDAARGEAERVAAAKAEAEAHAESVERELRSQRERRTALEHQLQELYARLETSESEAAALQAELDTERGDHISSRAELAAARDSITLLEAAREEAETAHRRESVARGALADELSDTLAQLDAAVGEGAKLRRDLERVLGELADAREQLEVERETAARLEAAAAHERAEMARLREDFDRESAENINARAELAGLREAHALAQAAATEAETALLAERQTRSATEAELHEIRGTLDVALGEAAALGAQLEADAAEKGRLLAELSGAQAELQTAHAQRDAIAAQLKAGTARLQTLERSLAKQDDGARQVEARLAAAEATAAKLREQAAIDERETAATRVALETLRGEFHTLESMFEAAARGVDELSRASTVADLLGALVQQLAGQLSRVALFRVKGNRLEGEHQAGFDASTDVTKLVMPLSLDSLLTRAASTGSVEKLSASDLPQGTPFGGNPAIALALPIAIQGETFAVVYADDGGHDARDKRVGLQTASLFATLVVRQAGVLLMRLTHELRALGELRDYAALLLQEAQQMFDADGDGTRSEDELRARLIDNLDCARQLYAQRASLEGSAAASLLDDHIAAVIDADPATPFARALRAITGYTSRRAEAAS
jgi:hypothetical protein